jgi:glutamate-1-semialdehyde 2,1-aminomutase
MSHDMETQTVLYLVGAAAIAGVAVVVKRRLDLSRAKHPSAAGHARLSRMLARLVPFYEFDERAFFHVDDAPREIAERRHAGFARLANLFAARSPRSLAATAAAEDGISDLRFTNAYRVPFPFRRIVRRNLGTAAFMQSAAGVQLRDLDGNAFYDLTGSYGVNVFGVDFYKGCMAQGCADAAELGLQLGYYHPTVSYNVARLREVSGLPEVSFHMSGTEAVMQAVRLARYHTGRRRLVRFCGAYHGWWGDVQPGVGNPLPPSDTLTLREMSERTLHVLRTRRDIACVLVNPVQALHPNQNPRADNGLVGAAAAPRCDRDAYAQWLCALRDACTANGIVLIFDEIFVGFRLAAGGAQEYFGVRADMVTYGKTVGGGFPIGVVCGRSDLMRRFRDARPADICFARGTFNSHPVVMGAMNEFLQHLETPQAQALYRNLDELWDGRARRLNKHLRDEALPVQVANISSIWTVSYTRPSRYNWMLQYYLRAEGLALSWIGTGRLIFSLN